MIEYFFVCYRKIKIELNDAREESNLATTHQRSKAVSLVRSRRTVSPSNQMYVQLYQVLLTKRAGLLL